MTVQLQGLQGMSSEDRQVLPTGLSAPWRNLSAGAAPRSPSSNIVYCNSIWWYGMNCTEMAYGAIGSMVMG
eukprot:2310823-Rhodomonas_salina.1